MVGLKTCHDTTGKHKDLESRGGATPSLVVTTSIRPQSTLVLLLSCKKVKRSVR